MFAMVLIGLFVIFSYGMGNVSAASGNTVYVNGSGGNDTYNGLNSTWTSGLNGPKATIKNATGTVNSNGTIYITKGTYNESNIQINTNMTIIGESQKNTIINGQQSGQSIFTIASGVNLTIANLTLTNGTTTTAGGAIYNDYGGTVTGTNITFTNNTATGFSGYAGEGGAIYNDGTITDTNNTFNNNATYGGAIFNMGLDGTAILNITNSTYTQNSASLGGAIYNYGDGGTAILNIINSTCTQSTASINGGAIYNYDTGILTVDNSTFTGNTGVDGGAIDNIGGWVTVKSSTFTGNSAIFGGAIYNYWSITKWSPSDVSLNVTDSTLMNNSAITEGGAIYNVGSAVLHFNRIVTNVAYVGTSPSGSAIYNNLGVPGIVNATLNWWGTNNGTKIAKMFGSVGPGTNIIYNPWIVLKIKANPASVYIRGTSTITANLLYSSNGVYHNPIYGAVPYNGSANFKTTKGAIKNNIFIKGKATSTLTKLNTTGIATVYAIVDGQKVTTKVTIRSKPISPLKK